MGRRTTTAAEELARNDDAETAAASGSDAQTPCASEDASGDLSSLDRPARRRRRGGERGKKSRARSSNARDDALARQSPIARAVLSAERSTELMKARSRGVDDENRGSELPPLPLPLKAVVLYPARFRRCFCSRPKTCDTGIGSPACPRRGARACGSCACRTRARATGLLARASSTRIWQ